jgi:NAD(P)-dependent dehydrogenase (short-subunit alcohol dehydrogenase family)
MGLKDKVVLITGGGSGIGAGAARAFVAAGARVVLNGRREGALRRTAEAIDAQFGAGRVAIAAGDIGDPETSRRMVAAAVRRFGGVDVLFNNAGVFRPKPFLDVTPADLDEYLRLVAGYYFAAQAAAAEMRRRGRGGAIVNTGSMWALHAVAATPCSASSMAKGGVHALTGNLAIELAPDRIRVNAIAPAVVETPLFDALLTPEQLAGFNRFHPLGRNGQPADVTEAVLFLADEERAGWITGVVLPVDGGVTAGRN